MPLLAEIKHLDPNVLATFLTAKLSFPGVCGLAAAMNHVPENFPKRDVFINNIVNAALEKYSPGVRIELAAIKQYCDLLEHCPFVENTTIALDDILADLSLKESVGYSKFLSPPTSDCLSCGSGLTAVHQPTRVTYFTVKAALPGSKVTLKCSRCKLSYSTHMYGNRDDGFQMYPKSVMHDYVEITEECFADHVLHEWMCSLANHCWVSFEGFSEAYNEVMRTCGGNSSMAELIKSVQRATPSTSSAPERISGSHLELTKKNVSDMFFNGELGHEIVNSKEHGGFNFNNVKDREKCMEDILSKLASSTYEHTCHKDCETRGCGKLYVLDGCWKLQFQHCLFQEKHDKALGITVPDVCTATPEYGKAFCVEHCLIMEKAGHPISLREFLSGSKDESPCEDHESDNGSDDLTVEQIDAINATVATVSRKTKKSYSLRNSVLQSQGTTQFVSQFPNITDDLTAEGMQPTCSKDLGGRKNPKRWSRGLLYLVRGGGHIELFRPLYRSESSSQVFLITVSWLYDKLQGIPESQWEEVIISYDDMCHLDNLKVAKTELPLPSPYNHMWQKVKKIIDRLHIKNHKDQRCHTVYSPDTIPAELTPWSQNRHLSGRHALNVLFAQCQSTPSVLYAQNEQKKK